MLLFVLLSLLSLINVIIINAQVFLDVLASQRKIWKGHLSRGGERARSRDPGMTSAQEWALNQEVPEVRGDKPDDHPRPAATSQTAEGTTTKCDSQRYTEDPR